MEKVCQNWQKDAFDNALVSDKYWDAFAKHAEMASAEIIRVADMETAEKEIEKLIPELSVKEIIATGGEEYPNLAKLYGNLKNAGAAVYTDKFDIAEHAPSAELGISTVEFGIGETGSVCADLFSYEARVTSMLPRNHIVFLNPRYTVETVTTAFEVISRVFNKGYMGFITGPSRTADIERVLSLGVHGPHRFFVMAVDNGFERSAD